MKINEIKGMLSNQAIFLLQLGPNDPPEIICLSNGIRILITNFSVVIFLLMISGLNCRQCRSYLMVCLLFACSFLFLVISSSNSLFLQLEHTCITLFRVRFLFLFQNVSNIK